MAFELQVIVVLIIVFWLCILSMLVWKAYAHYNIIFKGSKDKTVTAVLEKLIKNNQAEQKEITEILGRISKLEKNSLTHIQKIGLVRFNPFKDTGGEQSFILSLLDSQDSGLIISGLFARSGMRWYAKQIENGKGVDHELSEEEKKSITIAK